MNATTRLGLIITLALMPAMAGAQTPLEHRKVVFVEGGYARTVAPESLIGDGGSISGGFGFRLTPGKTIQGLVHYLKYDRNDAQVTFDGHLGFVGAEIVFQSNRPRVQPFVSVGAGVLYANDIRITRREISPGRIIVDPTQERSFTLKAMTASGGIDVRLNEHASIRAGARFHGVLEGVRPDDSIPFMVFRPNIGAAFRF